AGSDRRARIAATFRQDASIRPFRRLDFPGSAAPGQLGAADGTRFNDALLTVYAADNRSGLLVPIDGQRHFDETHTIPFVARCCWPVGGGGPACGDYPCECQDCIFRLAHGYPQSLFSISVAESNARATGSNGCESTD